MSKQSEGAVVRHPTGLGAWKPWEPLRGVMDEFFGAWPQDLRHSGVSLPRIDVTETDGDYRVRTELPGVSKDDVTVEFEQGVLLIRGEKKSRRDETLERGRRLECSYGTFSRSIALPRDADPEQISADYRDGVLYVTVAKGLESKPTRITVKG